MFSPLKRSRVYEEIVTNIRHMMDNGRLRPGDRLPSERELSAAFKVSRPSVREALKTLEHQGHLDIRQGEGTFIATRSIDKFIEPLAAAILTEKEYQVQILEMRRLVEPEIAFLAAKRATREEMSRMETTLLLQKERVSKGETGAELDKIFHYIIAQAAKNKILMQIIDTATDLFSENRRKYLQIAGRPTKSIRHHKEILGAIMTRDGLLASSIMNEHLDDIHNTLFATE